MAVSERIPFSGLLLPLQKGIPTAVTAAPPMAWI